jgi:hypothetical protein
VTRRPEFDDLVGSDLPADERERLRRTHELLVQAGPPPELSPGQENVPWPEDALSPLGFRKRSRRSRPLLVAVGFATAIALGFVLGQATNSNTTSIGAQRAINLHGTSLDRDAKATIELGAKDDDGNWPMVVRVTGLNELPEGGYYDLYLTHNGKPVALCGIFNVGRGETIVRLSAAYDLKHFDKNGWVVTRQLPGQHEPIDVVLKPSV